MKRKSFLKALAMIPAIGIAGIAKAFEEVPDLPGISRTSFKVKLEKNWFKYGLTFTEIKIGDIFRHSLTKQIVQIKQVVGFIDDADGCIIKDISECNACNFYFIASSSIDGIYPNGWEVESFYSFKTITEDFEYVCNGTFSI